MRRFGLLADVAGMLALVVLGATGMILGSSRAQVVRPCPEDIETIWAIEDARAPSDGPLATALEWDGVPLPYDRETNTFYCPIGLENGDDWPELHLTTADTRERVWAQFVDDYSYDSCREAVANGYAYEMIMYTERAYAYVRIVFTGLPIVSLTVEGEITREDTPADVIVSDDGEAAVRTHGRVHQRGGTSAGGEKMALRVEYTRRPDATGKTSWPTPGLGRTDTLVLIPMRFDRLMMRDRLSWALYGEIWEGRFGARAAAYAEVFVNNRYKGVYLMLTPFSAQDELAAGPGNHADTDSVYRTCVTYLAHGNPVMPHPFGEHSGFRLFYAPPSREPFADLGDYVRMLEAEDDDAFCRAALDCLDLDSMLRTLLLIQAGGMSDNVFNNLYIWAEHTTAGIAYHFFPWDMDMSWGMKTEDVGEEYDNWMHFPEADRLLLLNPGGDIRERLRAMWTRLRAEAFSLEHIEALLKQYAHELNDSGAMRRNAERWGTQDYETDGTTIMEFASVRFALLDDTFERLCGEETPLFLLRSEWENKGNPIEWAPAGETPLRAAPWVKR